MMNVFNTVVDFLLKWKDLIELIITVLAFVFSFIAMIKSSKADKLQKKINTLELQLKQNEVDKIKKEQEESEETCVEARVVNLGNDKYRMKVWNSGKNTVYNVTARFDGDVNIIIYDKDKQPFEELEPMKNYELVLIAYSGSASKFKIITEWEDKNGNKHRKEQLGDRT